MSDAEYSPVCECGGTVRVALVKPITIDLAGTIEFTGSCTTCGASIVAAYRFDPDYQDDDVDELQ